MEIAEKVTQSNTKKADAQQQYKEVKAEARKVNAFERPAQELPTDPWIASRL